MSMKNKLGLISHPASIIERRAKKSMDGYYLYVEFKAQKTTQFLIGLISSEKDPLFFNYILNCIFLDIRYMKVLL